MSPPCAGEGGGACEASALYEPQPPPRPSRPPWPMIASIGTLHGGDDGGIRRPMARLPSDGTRRVAAPRCQPPCCRAGSRIGSEAPRGCRRCGWRPRRCGLGDRAEGPVAGSGRGFGQAARDLSRRRWNFHSWLHFVLSAFPISVSPTSVYLCARSQFALQTLNPNPKPNQSSSRRRLDPASRCWLPQYLRRYGAASLCRSIALDSAVAWAGNHTVFF